MNAPLTYAQPSLLRRAIARNTPELIRLRMKHGAEGVGVYIMILDRLLDAPAMTDAIAYDCIAYDLRCPVGLVKDIIENSGLFAPTPTGDGFHPAYPIVQDHGDHDTTSKPRRGAHGKGKRQQPKAVDASSIALPQQDDCPNDTDEIFSDDLKEKQNKKEKNPPAPPIKEKNKKKENPPLAERRTHEPPPPDFENLNFEERLALLSLEKEWVASVAETFALTSLDESLALFRRHCINEGKTSHSDLTDLKSHFARWANIRQNDTTDNNNPRRPLPNDKPIPVPNGTCGLHRRPDPTAQT